MKTLYIHIGTGKTGTSAIQQYMFTYTEYFRENCNLHYCSTGLEHGLHSLLCLNYKRNQDRSSEVQLLLEELIDEITSSDLERFIISSEDFPGLKKVEIANFIKKITVAGINVKVIAYLRRQDELVESWYSQVIKVNGYVGDIYSLKDKLYKANVLNYEQMLSNWSSVIGDDSIIVRVFEKSRFVKNNVITDFLSIFGLDILPNSDVLNKIVNPSLTREQATLARLLDKYANVEQSKIFRTPLPIKDDKCKFFLSPLERKEILDDFNEINVRLAKRYCNRNELFNELSIDNNWSNVDIVNGGYLEKFICYLLYRHNDKLKIIEEALVRFLYTTSLEMEKNEKMTSLKLIRLALIVRPSGPLLQKKYFEYLNLGLVD